MTLKDTLFSQESKKQLVRKEMNYEFDKKEAVANAEHKKELEKQQEIAEEKNRKQKIILWSVAAGLFFVIVFAGFISRSLRITRRQKEIIEIKNRETEEQKKLIEEKNKDITDSINYAQRIQRALLASDGILNKNLGEHFVLFKPKDIVSGDFYWATEKEGRFYLAVCDSTGHGVPGAFMSLLNISFLNEAITEKGIVKPNEIFNHVRKRLIENISSEGAKDGMDGILVCFEKLPSPKGEGLGVRLTYAGANNFPVLINDVLQKLPTDNMPVGLGVKKDSFTHQTISCQSGNMLYFYTDGFADQFGGPKGKKFKHKQLNDMLSANSKKPLTKQKNILEQIFEDWKGNLEQVDDVLVIGIKI
jgi:serine phosphatase RsbU (regulator of sigma subunit)